MRVLVVSNYIHLSASLVLAYVDCVYMHLLACLKLCEYMFRITSNTTTCRPGYNPQESPYPRHVHRLYLSRTIPGHAIPLAYTAALLSVIWRVKCEQQRRHLTQGRSSHQVTLWLCIIDVSYIVRHKCDSQTGMISESTLGGAGVHTFTLFVTCTGVV